MSLNSVVGINNPKTMRQPGTLLNTPVVVMIEPGATHNYISLSVVEKLELDSSDTKEFGVMLGTGRNVKGRGECKDVRLCLGPTEDYGEFFSVGIRRLRCHFRDKMAREIGHGLD